MTSAETLNDFEQQLRRAVAERRYLDVQRLACSYCDSALVYLATLTPGDPQIAGTGLHVQEVLSWANLVLTTARSAISAPLTALPLISRYLAAPEVPSRTRLEA
jgi:hypothetical protein